MTHPTPDVWTRYLEQKLNSAARERFDAHCDECSSCETMRDLLVAPESTPSEELTLAAFDVIGSHTVTPAAEDAVSLAVGARDVRGSGAALAGEARIVGRSTEAMQISVMVLPPHGDGEWRLDGRLWLTDGGDREVDVILAHEDHVLQVVRCGSGGRFQLDECMPGGWRLEFHLSDGKVQVLEDPTA